MNADGLARLAFLLSRTEGTYAVLLGSGISSAAGVLTGWGIAMDLIVQMAVSGGEEAPGDPEVWYQEKFGEPVNYSDIVEWFGGTQAERTGLLSSYIEPNDDDIRGGKEEAYASTSRDREVGKIRMYPSHRYDEYRPFDGIGVSR